MESGWSSGVAVVRAFSSRELLPISELQRQKCISLTLDERESIVGQILKLLAEYHQIGHGPAETCRRRQISEQLRSLAIPLWLDGADDD